MIEFFKLDPIHAGNTPRGRLFKNIPKKINKSAQKSNPELSFVINSQSNIKFQKTQKSPSMKLFFDHFKQKTSKQLTRSFRLSPKKNQLNLLSNTSTFFIDKSEDLKSKFISETLKRKKLRSVCFTRKQKAKIELGKCMQSLYLKIKSDRIFVQNPKILAKQGSKRPYSRSLRQTFY